MLHITVEGPGEPTLLEYGAVAAPKRDDHGATVAGSILYKGVRVTCHRCKHARRRVGPHMPHCKMGIACNHGTRKEDRFPDENGSSARGDARSPQSGGWKC